MPLTSAILAEYIAGLESPLLELWGQCSKSLRSGGRAASPIRRRRIGNRGTYFYQAGVVFCMGYYPFDCLEGCLPLLS